MAKHRNPKLEKLLGFVIAVLIRVLGRTLRIRLHDPSGIAPTLAKDPWEPMIWALWHNRVCIQPYFYNKFFPKRFGTAMTSASGDGGLLADVLVHFRIQAARGSTSRRGAEALIHLIKRLKAGDDICIIPDGPRGPRYSFAPGSIRLAMKSGKPILPLHYEFSSSWQLKSWDAFIIPKPFSRVDVTLLEPVYFPAQPPDGVELDAYMEQQAARMREILLAPLSAEEIADAAKPEAMRPPKRKKPVSAENLEP